MENERNEYIYSTHSQWSTSEVSIDLLNGKKFTVDDYCAATNCLYEFHEIVDSALLNDLQKIVETILGSRDLGISPGFGL